MRHHSIDEQQYFAERQAGEQVSYYRSAIRILMYVFIFAFTAVFIRAPMPQRPVELTTYGFLAALSILVRFAKPLQRVDPRYVAVIIGVTVMIGSACSIRLMMAGPHEDSSVIVTTTYFIATLVTFTVLFPFSDGRVLWMLPFNVLTAQYGYKKLDETGRLVDLVMIVSAFTVLCIGLFYSRIYRGRREILSEFQVRNQLIQNERLRIQVVEQQISLANEIQDSLSPPRTLDTSFGAKARFYQKKFHPLGGDWMGVRTLANGDTVFAVVDVTGKGVAAALVVHAVQSLWAQAMSAPSFDIKQWLDSLNQALLTLGKNKPHTLTMCILVLSMSELTYYSAGHVPAYVMADRKDLDILVGRGNIVGFGESLDLAPVVFPLPIERSFKILIGTDGTLNRGTRVRRRELIKLIDRLDAAGELAIKDTEADDDQMLIVIDIPKHRLDRCLLKAG